MRVFVPWRWECCEDARNTTVKHPAAKRPTIAGMLVLSTKDDPRSRTGDCRAGVLEAPTAFPRHLWITDLRRLDQTRRRRQAEQRLHVSLQAVSLQGGLVPGLVLVVFPSLLQH